MATAPSMDQVENWYTSTYGGDDGLTYVQMLNTYNSIGPGAAPSNQLNANSPTTPPTGGGLAGVETTDANGNPVTGSDAVAELSTMLQSWGFGQDAVNWATQQVQSNNSVDQIIYSMRQQTWYKSSIFGQVMSARAAANLPAMTEAEILSYEDYAVGVADQAGLPQGFITTNELVQLMGKDVSTSELDARITDGYVAASKSDPATLASLQNYYGVTPGGLAAYYLDPNNALPLLQNQFLAAQMGGAATVSGWGNLSQQQAMELATLGVTQNQAQTGFATLAKQAQLMQSLPGESAEQPISQGVQLGAEFGGNGADQNAIAQRASEREAAFAGNYHFAETQGRGITGLGSTPRNG